MLRATLILALASCTPTVGGGGGTDGGPRDGRPGVDSAPQVGVRRFAGTLASTDTVAFGGSGFCDYTVTLKDVTLDVALRPASSLTTMVVEDTMVEATVGSCPYTPAPPSRQVFQHRGGPRTILGDGTLEPVLEGLAANQPMTAVTAVVTRGDSGAFAATVRWERTDQGPPIKWIVSTTAPIPLAAVACVPGGTYCLGGSVEGALYTCASDGLNLSELKQCASGCTPSAPDESPHRDDVCN